MFQWLLRRLFLNPSNKKGYTLIEMAAVVAITGTLAAMIIPIVVDKINEGKFARARLDVRAIATAITFFYKDTAHFPAWNGTGSVFNTAFHGMYSFLRSGDPEINSFGGSEVYLGEAKMDPDVRAWAQSPYIDNRSTGYLEYQLVKDFPGGIYCGYKNTGVNWKGAYSESLARCDPWGRNYLVLVYAMWRPTTNCEGCGVGPYSHDGPINHKPKLYGWIISAGPNNIVETTPESDKLLGDDVGMIFYAPEYSTCPTC